MRPSTAVFQSFNYADAVGDNQDARKENASRAEPKLTKWNDGGSHVGYSADGVPIVYSIPRLINGVLHVSTFLIDDTKYTEGTVGSRF